MSHAMKMPDLPAQLGYTSDHDLLRKTARRLLDDKCPLARVRALVDDDTGYDDRLLREIAELGWLGLALPEARGGAGLDMLSLALLAEETGRCLLPGPAVPSILAGLAIAEAAPASAHLPALATGETIATVALPWDPDSGATAVADGDGYVVDGVIPHVPWARAASLVITPLAVDREVAVFAIDPAAATVAPEIGIDSTRRADRLELRRLRVGDDALLGDAAAWRRFELRALTLLAAEAVGAAQRILSITRDYAVERTQFNRQIGSFQAVKHPIVDVMIAVEKARSLTYGAAAALDADPDHAELHARAAKVAASDALTFAADRGVQFHGGYGFTWDCDAHFFLKRAIWTAATLGDGTFHRRRIADALAG
jgi:alkylation response protein AidB-like acyl-CoA dehydrogenase